MASHAESAAAAGVVIRDRVVEMRRVPAAELQDNARNWRLHPYAQRKAVMESLQQVGIAGVLTAYHSQRNGGALTLIDGHERHEDHPADWPTVILDVTDEEADLLLLTLDPTAAMAQADAEKLNALLDDTRVGTVALEDLFQSLRASAHADEEMLAELAGGRAKDRGDVLPEMELQPFEHYDYVVLLCRTTHDWTALQELLGIERAQYSLPRGERRVGMGRVIDAGLVVERLRERPPEDTPPPPPAKKPRRRAAKG